MSWLVQKFGGVSRAVAGLLERRGMAGITNALIELTGAPRAAPAASRRPRDGGR